MKFWTLLKWEVTWCCNLGCRTSKTLSTASSNRNPSLQRLVHLAPRASQKQTRPPTSKPRMDHSNSISICLNFEKVNLRPQPTLDQAELKQLGSKTLQVSELLVNTSRMYAYYQRSVAKALIMPLWREIERNQKQVEGMECLGIWPHRSQYCNFKGKNSRIGFDLQQETAI